MVGSFFTRGLVMIFGYAYPAYECFKTVEKSKPEIEKLRFWCQYWILVAVLTVCERIGDAFVSWLPMYSEAKLVFFIYLWCPKTMGTTFVYDSFFKPYVSKHETEIDRNLLELRTKAGDMVVSYFQKAASYGQTRVFDILQYVASQSSPTPRPPQTQPQPEGTRAARRPAGASNCQVSARPKPQIEEPSSPTSSTSSSQHQKELEQEMSSPPAPSAASAAPAPPTVQNPLRRFMSAPTTSTQLTLKKTAQQSDPKSSNHSSLKKTTSEPPESTGQSAVEVDSTQIEPVPAEQDKAKTNLPPQETVMEEAIRVTRGRLRKARSTAK